MASTVPHPPSERLSTDGPHGCVPFPDEGFKINCIRSMFAPPRHRTRDRTLADDARLRRAETTSRMSMAWKQPEPAPIAHRKVSAAERSGRNRLTPSCDTTHFLRTSLALPIPRAESAVSC
jgi:hypothetical protein